MGSYSAWSKEPIHTSNSVGYPQKSVTKPLKVRPGNPAICHYTWLPAGPICRPGPLGSDHGGSLGPCELRTGLSLLIAVIQQKIWPKDRFSCHSAHSPQPAQPSLHPAGQPVPLLTLQIVPVPLERLHDAHRSWQTHPALLLPILQVPQASQGSPNQSNTTTQTQPWFTESLGAFGAQRFFSTHLTRAKFDGKAPKMTFCQPKVKSLMGCGEIWIYGFCNIVILGHLPPKVLYEGMRNQSF